MSECVCVWGCGCVCVRLCEPRGCVGAPLERRGPGGIYSSACDSRTATRARCVWCHRSASRALAAGVTWTSRTTSAQWAARHGHTSVIDAAGAIYVIGGRDGSGTLLSDVWVSTDGGA